MPCFLELGLTPILVGARGGMFDNRLDLMIGAISRGQPLPNCVLLQRRAEA